MRQRYRFQRRLIPDGHCCQTSFDLSESKIFKLVQFLSIRSVRFGSDRDSPDFRVGQVSETGRAGAFWGKDKAVSQSVSPSLWEQQVLCCKHLFVAAEKTHQPASLFNLLLQCTRSAKSR